jgi:hypothetical protein
MKELLILLCRYPFDPVNKDRLRELLNQVKNWHKTVELINAHGIIALAAYNIKEAGLEKEIPEEAMAILENGQRQSMVRNLWLTERWKEVYAILRNAGIKHILLKGMALEHTLYGSRGLRQMYDCDILVEREHALKAWNLLQHEGFSINLIKSPLYKRILLHIGKHLPSLYKDGYSVEIHHKLFDTKSEEKKRENEYFKDSVEVTIGETKALMLSREIQLKYLISHYEKHALEGSCQLRLYADIILLDTNSPVSLPDHFISEANQENKPKYMKAAYKLNIKSIVQKYRFRYIIGDLFPSVEWMKRRYGCSGFKAVFYYPQRIGKLLWLL